MSEFDQECAKLWPTAYFIDPPPKPPDIDITGSPTHDRGPVMQLYSGKPFYPLDPRPEEIELTDIAHALSLLCRYGGHAKHFYSVAQHSIGVSYVIGGGPLQQIWGLMHDAAEAYVGDLTRPMKQALSARAPQVYGAIESAVMQAIRQRFNLGPEPTSAVKHADNIMAATEKRDIMRRSKFSWGQMPAPLAPFRLTYMSAHEAKAAFLARYAELHEAILIGIERRDRRFAAGDAS